MSDSTLNQSTTAKRGNSDGLGLVEVVVSMFLLAIIAMAMIPLLAQGIKASVSNRQMATATQLVNQRLDAARSSSASCAALRNIAAVSITPVVDVNGVTFAQTQTVGACPTAFPALVSYATTVTVSGQTVSNASMSILVTGA